MEQLSNKELAQKIRKLARERGWLSDATICDAAGFDNRMVIKNIESAKIAPRMDTIIKFANLLDVDINVLVYKELNEIDDVIYKDISDAINEFLKEHNLTISAKKRKEAVKDFYNRGLRKEDIKKELLKSLQWGLIRQIKVKI